MTVTSLAIQVVRDYDTYKHTPCASVIIQRLALNLMHLAIRELDYKYVEIKDYPLALRLFVKDEGKFDYKGPLIRSIQRISQKLLEWHPREFKDITDKAIDNQEVYAMSHGPHWGKFQICVSTIKAEEFDKFFYELLINDLLKSRDLSIYRNPVMAIDANVYLMSSHDTLYLLGGEEVMGHVQQLFQHYFGKKP